MNSSREQGQWMRRQPGRSPVGELRAALEPASAPMRLAISGLMATMLASVGCTPPNTSPSAVITAPLSGAVLKPGTVTLQGQVGDLESPAASLSASFAISTLDGNTAGSCNAVPADDGTVSCTLEFTFQGDFEVGLYVADPEGLQGTAVQPIRFQNQTPTVVFESPADGSTTYSEKTPLTLITQVTDADDTQLNCAYSSDLSGPLGTVGVDPLTGRCSLTLNLSRGVHLVTVTGSDPLNASASDSITLPIKSCTDLDGDGFSQECDNDCNDSDATVYPGAIEACDRKDNDCNTVVDDAPDQDADGFNACTGDCDDTLSEVNPIQLETCDGLDNNCVLGVDEGFDTDKDGYNDVVRCPTTGTDCDDRNASISPGAGEICDGVDNNCNGAIDDGAESIFFYDLDGDGYGDPGNTEYSCSQPLGTVTNASDCDDSAVSINPQGVEACNGKDDDCDGVTDEDTTPKTFYPDVDGDSYGVQGSSTQSGCVAPLGYAEATGDCNDNNAAVNPGATEVCDTIDNNCNTQTDEGVILTFYRDSDGDTYGVDTDKKTGCAAPSGYASRGGDCNDGNKDVNPGATEQCDSIDNNCNGQVDDQVTTKVYYKDGDADGYGDNGNSQTVCARPTGYVEVGGDCNDANPAINPAATEICDTKDNNCNAQVDEGVTSTFYRDADADGYGNPNGQTIQACAATTGYVSNKTDCNDNSNTSYPGATELCDGLDNDCDATLDEGLTQKTFYRDSDGDKYGSATVTISACAAPPGYVTSNTDCNDANSTTYPTATETCDGEDDDCDTKVDEGTNCYDDDADGYTENQGDCNDANAGINPGAKEPTTPNGVDENCNNKIDDTTVCWDDDGDGYIEQATAQSCPGYAKGAYGSTIPLGNDCDDTRNSTYPGAPERFNGRDDDCDLIADEDISLANHWLTVTGDLKSAKAGFSVAIAGDVNNDGLDDLLIGAPQRDSQSQSKGAAALILGRSSGWASNTLPLMGYILEDDLADARAGWAVAGAGDLDNDGFDDFAIGAPNRTANPGGLANAGRMYVLYGKQSWTNGSLPTAAEAYADGIQSNVLLGYSLAGGADVNADGRDDLALGGPWPTTPAKGYLMVLQGRSTRYSKGISVGDLFKVDGNGGDALGVSMAILPDATGDDLGDILVSGYGSVTTPPSKSNAGVAYFIPGSTKITPTQTNSLSSLGAVAWRGDTNDELVGSSVASAGDVNGDGITDLLVGRGLQSSTTQGEAYLILGGIIPAGGNPESAADVRFLGDSFGCPCTVAGVGDVNDDGMDDFAIGVTKSDLGGTDSGAVYLYYGNEIGWGGTFDVTEADVIFRGVAGEGAGSSIAGAGDLNGDGIQDLVIGAPGYDASSLTDAGRVYIFFGYR